MKFILNLLGVVVVSVFAMVVGEVNFTDAMTYSMVCFLFVDRFYD